MNLGAAVQQTLPAAVSMPLAPNQMVPQPVSQMVPSQMAPALRSTPPAVGWNPEPGFPTVVPPAPRPWSRLLVVVAVLAGMVVGGLVVLLRTR